MKTVFAFAVAAAGLVVFYWVHKVFLLAFLGVLLAVLLSTVADWGVRHLKMRRGVAVVSAGVLFALLVAGVLVLMAVPIATQGQDFADAVPKMIESVRDKVQTKLPWLGDYLPGGGGPAPGPGESAGKAIKSVALAGASFLEGVVKCLAAFFLGLFLAWDPDHYRRAAAELWPGNGTTEEKVRLLERMAEALGSYLLTLAIQIAVMAVSWSVGLWLIGIDYYLLFGAIGGLVEVVPYVGPLLGLVPPLAIALAQDPTKAVLVVVLYVVLHITESYLLVPWLLHREEHVPPPIVVLSILVFGTAFGGLGVLLALPLGTVVYVWVNDYLMPRRKRQEEPKLIERPEPAPPDMGGLSPA